VKTLTPETRQDNTRFFNEGEATPTHCVTQGIGTILDARQLLLVATGHHKAEAVALAVEGPLSSAHPASAVQLHPHCTVVLDDAAASRLQHRSYYEYAWRNRHSWLDGLEHPTPVGVARNG
jgi:glucosamine-6-phosphate deaminase